MHFRDVNCKKFKASYKRSNMILFPTNIISNRSKKNVIPIIWDDMLRTIPAHVLVDSELGQIVEPMVIIVMFVYFRFYRKSADELPVSCLFTIFLFQVWVYVEDVDRFVDSLTWSNYGEVFPHIWVIP